MIAPLTHVGPGPVYRDERGQIWLFDNPYAPMRLWHAPEDNKPRAQWTAEKNAQRNARRERQRQRLAAQLLGEGREVPCSREFTFRTRSGVLLERLRDGGTVL